MRGGVTSVFVPEEGFVTGKDAVKSGDSRIEIQRKTAWMGGLGQQGAGYWGVSCNLKQGNQKKRRVKFLTMDWFGCG